MTPTPQAQVRKLNAAVTAVIAALIISTSSACQRNNAPTTRKITIAQYGDVFLYAPIYIAKEAGFFAKRGLDVSLVSTGGDDKTWAAVISGSASFGVADPTFVAISELRGQPGRVIASIVNGVPFWGITLKQGPYPRSRLQRISTITLSPPSRHLLLLSRSNAICSSKRA